MTMDEFGLAIVAEARRWKGTPYVHQASVCGAGADCLGLVRGVWRVVVGPEPQGLPKYTPDWGEVSKNEFMLNAARRWFLEIPVAMAGAGDLVVFRWRKMSVAKHAGILTTDAHFIHAYEKAGVVETCLGEHWRKRIAAAFKFPHPDQMSQ